MSSRIKITAKYRPEPDVDRLVFILLAILREQQTPSTPAPKPVRSKQASRTPKDEEAA